MLFNSLIKLINCRWYYEKTIWIYPEVEGYEIIELSEEFKMVKSI